MQISPGIRISVGLVLLTISIILVGDLFGLVPNRRTAVLDARKKVCESLAVQVSLAVQLDDTRSIQRILEEVEKRNQDVLSVALRSKDGAILARAGEHKKLWEPPSNDRSTPTHAQVPIFRGKERWASIEVRFSSLFPKSFMGIHIPPLVKMLGFVGLSCFFAYFFFMRRTLRHLDPSAVVPTRVKHALNVLAEGVVLMDEEERIVLANSTFAKTVGLSPSSLMGMKASEFGWSVARAKAKGEDLPWQRSYRTKRVEEARLLLKGEAKNVRILMVKASPILDDRNTLRGILATFDDMTDLETKNNQLSNMVGTLEGARAELSRKNDELEETNRAVETKVVERTKELYKSMEAAQAADHAKSVFLANMSHELRTPMHGILSFAQFGVDKIEEASKDTLLSYFGKITKCGGNMMDLLNNLLDISKFRAGKMECEMESGRLSVLVESVMAEFSASVAQKKLRLEYTAPAADTSGVFDNFRMAQVIRNLLSNAVKFTPGDKAITISLGECTIPVEGHMADALTLTVEDEGVGVPEEELESIFDPFAQSERTSTGAGGTGLGLAICKEVILAHHGTIHAAVRPEGGSVFSFTIPRIPLKVMELALEA